MELRCPECTRILSFTGERPSFCGFCGHALEPTAGGPDATGPYAPPADQTTPYAPGEAGPPDTVGEYRLVRALGRGGMGSVWEAEQLRSGRRVALKLLSPDLPRTGETLARFRREGQLAAALSSPRSTFVYEAGEDRGQPYIAMELMPGRTLKDVVREEGPLPVNRAVDYVLDVTDGLEAAHALGIIHRDVKPANCFLDADGRAKVGDFGLSKSLISDAALTHTGAFMGTPLFAAPEQVRGRALDRRTDVYAVGATLFYLLAGRGPFTGDAAAVIAQIASDPPPSLHRLRPAVPRDLDRVVARTLEKDPARRYANLARLRRALLPFATGGTSIADVGRRLAAYMVDSMAVTIAADAIWFGAGAAMAGQRATALVGNAVLQLLSVLAPVVYFALAEGRWGRGLCKLLLGLRVVGPEGEPVGVRRTLLRALFIPGALGLSLLPPLYALLVAVHPEAAGWPYLAGMLGSLVLVAPGYAVTLGCLVTMRARNGYRALHEFASGTRVLRLRTAAAAVTWDVPLLVPAALPEAAPPLGPFRVVGTLGQNGPATVVQARDDVLHRSAWVYLRAPGQPALGRDRIGLARPGRPHWLQGGEDGGRRWDAFEAVDGAPLREVVRRPGGLEWERGRQVLRDLAAELAAAIADGTLPGGLTLDLVWVDRGGHVKLLDAPVWPTRAATPPEESTAASGPEGAVALLRSATELCTRGQILPLPAQAFVRALAGRPGDRETLAWAVEQLRDLSQRPAVLKWDYRLATLAVSLGTELSLYMALAFGAGYYAWGLSGLPVVVRAALVVVAVLLVPAVLGAWPRGGPVFWFTGVAVCRADGRPAGRLRCAWRNVLAWTPLTIPYCILGGCFLFLTAHSGQSFAPSKLAFTLLGLICCAELLGLVGVVGAVYAVVRPQRGIQDFLAGTRLVPR